MSPQGNADLSAPVRSVVGPKTAAALEEHLGIRTVEDLLRHYPRRYYERGELTDLRSLRVGERATVQARIASISGGKLRDRKLHKTDIVITDGSGRLRVTFFNQPYLLEKWKEGSEVVFAGTVEVFHNSMRFTNPEYDREHDSEPFAGGLLPIYPAAKGLDSWKIARCVRVVLDILGPLEDPLPPEVRSVRKLPDLRTALEKVHRPETARDHRFAKSRLRFEEAFVLQAALARRRAEQRAALAIPRRPRPDGLAAAFDARLPFDLTAGQLAVGEELAHELAEEHPMHRLLQGEVGSGKTVVALRAMLAVVDAGGQAALLAPTEVLAVQHDRSIRELLGPLAEGGLLGGADLATRVALLTGAATAGLRRQVLLEAASGAAGIVIGTHALIQEVVQFADLGLVVVDEQHRFGVEQRDALRAKATRPPHLLVMTATPIPRTVAMTVFGDLDVSTLTELPAGRGPVQTHVVAATERPRFMDRTWERVREEVGRGRQAFVVCPRIGDGDEPVDRRQEEIPEGQLFADEDAAPRRPGLAVLEVAELLAQGPLAGLRIGVLHGRMPADDKDAVMRRFSGGDLDVLVATTVIEVGVDVPSATAMVVMDADRFGVSQLHQLRGRIGRGEAGGVCLLVTEAAEGTAGRRRLDAVAATRDGFELSRVDLAARREGDVLGSLQSGRRSSLRLLSVLRDEALIAEAREQASAVLRDDPTLERHPALLAALDTMMSEERVTYLEKA